jgi:hypothetical protein
MEAPAMFKQNGYYFIFASHLTGWAPNDNMYSYATSLSGPWSSWTTFATVGTDTYSSQTNYILPFPGGNTVLYMGDRWEASSLFASTYIWLPLTISGTNITMPDRTSWIPNVTAGTWSLPPAETENYGVNATLTNGAKLVSCSGCYDGEAAGYIGGSSEGTATISDVSAQASTLRTVQIKYKNGDSTARYANVTVNGATQLLEFLPTFGGANTPGTSVLFCNIQDKGDNQVIITTSDGTYGPDIDMLVVPES